MSTRPVIFISAVSSELKTARQAVANCVTSLGYTPEWQDIFATESGPLLRMLRQKVDRAAAVIQIVGQCYGAEPETPPPGFPRCSYTQYEALYALSRKRPVYYITLGPAFPADSRASEPDDLRDLQFAYIKSIEAAGHLRHPAATSADLENKVLRLRDDLARLRRRTLQWAAALTLAVLLIAGGVTWLIFRPDAAATRDAVLLEALRRLPAAVAETSSQGKGRGEADPVAEAYRTLEHHFQLTPGALQSELPDFAARLQDDPEASALDRAYALYAEKRYAESETAALAVRDDAMRQQPPDTATALEALETAGSAAGAQIQYERALAHYESAAALTDKARDPEEWARIHHQIAYAADDTGDYRRAASLLNDVITVRESVLGWEHPDTLASRINLGNALCGQGKNAQAEAEYRAVLAVWKRELGLEHPDTLACWNNLANALRDQGKNKEAEAEHRARIDIEERVLGPEHPGTLYSRNNLGTTLRAQGKNKEAEAEYRAVLAVWEREPGPEHPDTLQCRNNLGTALREQGKNAEAEAVHRAVLAVRERVLPTEHPDTLRSHWNLSLCLKARGVEKAKQKDHKEARQLWEEALLHAQEAMLSGKRTLEPEHPQQIKYAIEVKDLQTKLSNLPSEN